MVIGTTLLVLGGATYFSPLFGRGGPAAVFACEMLVVGGSPTLDIEVQHKNSEDTVWSALGSFASISAVGITTKDLSGIKEQVRFKYTLSSATTTDAVHFNMLAPSWRPL